MSEIRTCNDGHEYVAYVCLKCPVCEEQEKVVVAEEAEKKLRDFVDKVQELVDGQ